MRSTRFGSCIRHVALALFLGSACLLADVPSLAADAGAGAGYAAPETHFAAALNNDFSGIAPELANSLPANTVEIGVLPGFTVDLGGWALFNEESCKEIGHGKYKVKTAPKFGKMTFKLVSGIVTGGICVGAKGDFLVAYYTWTNSKTVAKEDFFDIEWLADNKQCTSNCTINEDFLAVKGPRVFFYDVVQGKYVDVTSEKTTVALGQAVYLSAEPVISKQVALWKVPGTSIGGYTPVTGSFATGKTEPTKLKGPYTLIYWLDTANDRLVTFTDKFDGRTVTANTNFNVVGPTDIKVETKVGKVQILDKTNLSFGNSSEPGVTFTASARAPNGYSPSFEWVQLQTKDSIDETKDKVTQTCTNGLGLDDVFPYAIGNETSISPVVALPAADSNVRVSDAYAMHLLWTSNIEYSIPVSLGVVYSGWSGGAYQDAKTHVWKATNPKGTASVFKPNKLLPQWTSVVTTTAPTCD